MKKGILAKKIGMTQIFLEDGKMLPVTVLEAGPCTVIQKKTNNPTSSQKILLCFLGGRGGNTFVSKFDFYNV